MQELKFDLAHARSIRRIRQKKDSWSPLAEGQVIAQPFLKPIVCHAGYDVDGVKRAIIWANNGKLTGYFELVDVTVNKQPPGKPAVVYRGKLEKFGFHIWGGNNYIAGFSDFKKEGLYWLRLRVKETKEVVESYIFRIKRNLYLDLAKRAAKWFYYQRCGTEVPGWHGACHTQDAIILEDGTRIDATGGWHDAGDYGKWLGPGAEGIWALTTLVEEASKEMKRDEIYEILEEASWEGKYICKVYHKGLKVFLQVYTSSKNFPLSDEYPPLENVCIWLGAPEKEPPRVVTLKEALERSNTTLSFTVYVAGSLAKLGRLILEYKYDSELSEKCIAIAEDVYKKAISADLSKPEYEKDRASYLLLQARMLLLDLELYRVYKEQRYIEDAEKRVREILALQDEKGFFYMNKSKTSEYMQCSYHLVGLYDFLRLNLDENLNERIREAFKRWIDYVEPFTKASSFGQVGSKDEKGRLRNLGRNAFNRMLGAYAWGFATAAMLFNESRYLEMAEHQIQWILGLNPCDVSMMVGVGAGPGCYHHRYCFIDGHEDGVVPGGVLNGMVGGNGEVFDIGDFRTGNFVISDKLPIDYPIIDTDVRGWTYAYLTNEYWIRNNAWFIMGAIQTHRALKELKQK